MCGKIRCRKCEQSAVFAGKFSVVYEGKVSVVCVGNSISYMINLVTPVVVKVSSMMTFGDLQLPLSCHFLFRFPFTCFFI